MGEIVFAEERFFIEAEIAGDGADKAAIEDTAGEFAPIFVFESFEEARTNTRGGSDLCKSHLAQLALAFQPLSESSPGHSWKPNPMQFISGEAQDQTFAAEFRMRGQSATMRGGAICE